MFHKQIFVFLRHKQHAYTGEPFPGSRSLGMAVRMKSGMNYVPHPGAGTIYFLHHISFHESDAFWVLLAVTRLTVWRPSPVRSQTTQAQQRRSSKQDSPLRLIGQPAEPQSGNLQREPSRTTHAPQAPKQGSSLPLSILFSPTGDVWGYPAQKTLTTRNQISTEFIHNIKLNHVLIFIKMISASLELNVNFLMTEEYLIQN